MLKKSMYLDDIRNPKIKKDWVIARNFYEAKLWMLSNGCPEFISFDHDIASYDEYGFEVTGYDLAKWIVNRDLDMNGTFIPENFEWNVHSANPTGRDNIDKYLFNYMNQKNS